MIRSLWTAGSGMIAQQLNVDVISNNLANVNTTSYKKERAEFRDTLYDTMSKAYMAGGTSRPVNMQVGNGATVSAVVRDFQRGNLEKTDGTLDFAIDGDAFFMVRGPTPDWQLG
jgi:flagellar basal-body rod protein FlgG